MNNKNTDFIPCKIGCFVENSLLKKGKHKPVCRQAGFTNWHEEATFWEFHKFLKSRKLEQFQFTYIEVLLDILGKFLLNH